MVLVLTDHITIYKAPEFPTKDKEANETREKWRIDYSLYNLKKTEKFEENKKTRFL